MKARFTDEQIIQMIKEQESGERTADVCRCYGISQGTFYKYKSKYGSMAGGLQPVQAPFSAWQYDTEGICKENEHGQTGRVRPSILSVVI
jgi:transposase-like protein